MKYYIEEKKEINKVILIPTLSSDEHFAASNTESLFIYNIVLQTLKNSFIKYIFLSY